MDTEKLKALRGKDVRVKDSWGYVIDMSDTHVTLSGWNWIITSTHPIDQIQQVRNVADRGKPLTRD